MRICFNGATSTRSWKWTRRKSGVRGQRGFNGATSARSWKSNRSATYHVGLPASMGPRARARGNADGTVACSCATLLQWGHERALVEMTFDAAVDLARAKLQWGHERALVEIG